MIYRCLRPRNCFRRLLGRQAFGTTKLHLQLAVTFLTLNNNLLSFTFLLVRTPEQGSVRPTYSFVHMALAMPVAEHAATTRSRPERAAQIQRGLYASRAWTIGCKSWPVSERDFFLLVLRPGRTGGLAW
jgi:hypothetical protein